MMTHRVVDESINYRINLFKNVLNLLIKGLYLFSNMQKNKKMRRVPLNNVYNCNLYSPTFTCFRLNYLKNFFGVHQCNFKIINLN